MRGHIRRSGKGSWELIVELPKGADGKRNRRFISFKGRKPEAEAKLAEILTEVHQGRFVEPSKMTLGVLLDRWLDQARKSQTISGKTLDEYTRMADNHIKPCLGNHRLARLKPLHIQEYYADRLANGRMKVERPPAKQPRKDAEGNIIPRKEMPKGLSAQTVRHHHTFLHKVLADAVRWQIIPNNPADFVTPPKVQREEMQILDAAQIQSLLEVSQGSRYRIAFVIGVLTGMRRGEILALRWDDVDLEKAQISVSKSLQKTSGRVLTVKGTKTGKIRVIPISAKTVQELRMHKARQAQEHLLLGVRYQANGLVCSREDGSFVDPDTLTGTFAKFSRQMNLQGVRLHDLRHTHVALLIAQGEHVKVISERLGHSSITVTMDRYGHLFPSLSRSAADRLDAALGW